MFRSRTATIIFLVALAAAIGLRLLVLVQKNFVTHDEGISYLAATGYEEQFALIQEGGYPAGEWVRAAEWKQFMYPARDFSPDLIAGDIAQIGRDLARYDIHPPLYFWFLYIWVKIFGVHTWAGPSLNALIDLIAMLCLARLAFLTLHNEIEAALVTFIWGVSPSVVEVASEARQYSLLALLTILFVWQIIRLIRLSEAPAWWNYLLLTVTVAAGLLTHYHFALVLLGTAILLAAKLIKQDARRLAACLLAIGLGCLLFLAVHPYFYLSFQSLATRQRLEARYLFGSLAVIQRIYQAVVTFSRFLVYGPIFEFLFFVLFTSSIIWLGLVYLRNRPRLRQMTQSVSGPAVYIMYYFFWLYGITLLLYLSFLTPANGMSARHLSFVWPFFAFIPVLLLRPLPPKVARVAIPLLLASVCLFTVTYALRTNDDSDWVIQLDHSSMVIVDTTHRGILPRVLWYLPDDKPILAADQAYLLAHPELWSGVLDERSYYVSDLSYDNTVARRHQILEILRQTHQVEESDFSVGTLFRLSAVNDNP